MTESSNPDSLKYFDTLRAENETAWLSRAFIPPPDYEVMQGMRSIIVFGGEGSGKTALSLALIASARENPIGYAPLIVEWQPGVQDEVESEVAVAQFLNEVLELTAQTLAYEIANRPMRFLSATRWTQEALVWLLHRYMKSNLELFLLRIEENVPPEGLNCLKDVMSRQPKELLASSAPYPRQVNEVIQVLKTTGFGGLWVIIDGLESWFTTSPIVLGKTLTALFSSLSVLDTPGFAVKVMAPSQLKNLISASTGLVRRRFEAFDLDWPNDALKELCERRMALAIGHKTFPLSSLTKDTKLIGWLKKYGGSTPRGWLESLRPFLSTYLDQPQIRPLTVETVAEIQRRFPPRLRIELASDEVFLGYQAITGLSSSLLAILRYLYQHPNRFCRKEELYYRGLRGLDHEPRKHGDADFEPPDSVEGMIDTAIWRLRQVIEPDPKQPIYVVSERGKGIIRLKNAW